jgi:hypothetical protein
MGKPYRVIVKNSDNPEYKGHFEVMLRKKVELSKMLAKLKEIVEQAKSYEEESLMYKYRGKDKDEIWSCMEFFYQNLWNKDFREFVWTDPTDNWENYHIALKYKDKWAEVQIVYGIGAFCVIGPGLSTPWTKDLKYLDLDKVNISTTTDVIYME